MSVTTDMNIKFFLFAVLAALVLSPMTAKAEIPPALANRVQEAEAYLRGIGTLQADFVQTAYNGTQLTGRFYLSRPGRLRFEYNEVDDFIVADGTFIYYYDSEMKQQSNTTISNSLADFLLRRDLSFSGDVRVTDVTQTANGFDITLAVADDPGAGSLTLGFVTAANDGIVLENWRVRDSQNLTTRVDLDNVQTGVSFRRNLFYYLDPQRFGRPR